MRGAEADPPYGMSVWMDAVSHDHQNEKTIVASWTGGKDGCLAAYRAMLEGYRISHLLAFRSMEKDGAHDINPALLRAQAEAIGIPIVERDYRSYERAFLEVVDELRRTGVRIDGAVFGHIATHGSLVERVCGTLGLDPVLPLWGRDPRELITEIVEAGFEAVIIGVRDGVMGSRWLGRRIDASFLRELAEMEPGVDPCGENGEFHTVVTDGPIFSRRIAIEAGEPIQRDGHWLLRVTSFSLVEKERFMSGSGKGG